MKAEESAVPRQGNLDCRLERRDEGAVRLGELRERPIPHGALLRRYCLAPIVAGQDEGIGIAEHDGTCQFPQTRHDLSRLRPTLDGVAEADGAIHGMRFQISQYRIERDAVTVHVRYYRDAH
jgi:hypothetical protein